MWKNMWYNIKKAAFFSGNLAQIWWAYHTFPSKYYLQFVSKPQFFHSSFNRSSQPSKLAIAAVPLFTTTQWHCFPPSPSILQRETTRLLREDYSFIADAQFCHNGMEHHQSMIMRLLGWRLSACVGRKVPTSSAS
jgi:hypothetical protein